MKRKAVSSMIAELILILIAVVSSIAVFGIVVNKGIDFQRGASIQLTGAALQSFGNGQGLLTVSVTNTGSVPEFAGLYLSGLPAIGSQSEPGIACGTGADGYLYYTALNLLSGSYSFTVGGGDGSTVLINGPSTGHQWESLTGPEYYQGTNTYTVSLQGGTYQIVIVNVNVCGPGYSTVSTNLPASTTWLVVLYHMPNGTSVNDGQAVAPPFSALLRNPLNFTAYGGEVAWVQVVQGNSFYGSYRNGAGLPNPPSGVQPAVPLGLVEPGQSVKYSWIVDGSWAGVPPYSTGQGVSVYVEAWTLHGSASTVSLNIVAE